MLADENHPTRREKPSVHPGNYNPVIVYMNGNSLGAIFLGILSCMLLIGLMRTEARYYTLLTQLKQVEGRKLTISE